MRILILGGTRFIGKKLASSLLQDGFEVIISSRRENLNFPQNQQLIVERENLSKVLAENLKFDYVFDFTGYTGAQIAQLPPNLIDAHYIFISTAWINRVTIHPKEITASNSLSRGLPTASEFNYIKSKIEAEKVANEIFHPGLSILRLPIVLGESDHHHRLDYYCQRLIQFNRPIIIDEGENLINIIWVEDLISLIRQMLNVPSAELPSLLDFAPRSSISVRELISDLAYSQGIESEFTNISHGDVEFALPTFVRTEPLWREVPFAPVGTNAWDFLNKSSTSWNTVFERTSFSKNFNKLQLEALIEEGLYLDRKYRSSKD